MLGAFTLLTALLVLPTSLARDRLGLKAHRPSEKLARKAAAEARAAEAERIELERRWANDTGGKDYRYLNNQTSGELSAYLPIRMRLPGSVRAVCCCKPHNKLQPIILSSPYRLETIRDS